MTAGIYNARSYRKYAKIPYDNRVTQIFAVIKIGRVHVPLNIIT